MKKVIIIAEAGVNHNGSVEMAKDLIDTAAIAGADYVKFQTFKADQLVTRNAQMAKYQSTNLGLKDDQFNDQFTMLKNLELSINDHIELIKYCQQKGIKFLSTGFDMISLQFLNSLNLDLVKIPSGELTNLPYLKYVAKPEKKIILSTGMANLDEIKEAILVLRNGGVNDKDITILHCTTEYPTPYEEVNLNAMLQIREYFGVDVGYSDHTIGIEVPIAAVALGATVIEKHFTLDNNLEGPDHRASLNPSELIAMVSSIRNIEKSMGNGYKKPTKSESENIKIARKSIHLANSLKTGDEICESDLIMKRPGDGISPMLMYSVIGKYVNKDLPQDYKLSFNDIIS